VTMSYT